VDLPEGMPKQIFKQLQSVRVVGRELRISRVNEKPPKPPRDPMGRHTVSRHTGDKPTAARQAGVRPTGAARGGHKVVIRKRKKG
jgi:ATP-dependent RNA helicase DeaD